MPRYLALAFAIALAPSMTLHAQSGDTPQDARGFSGQVLGTVGATSLDIPAVNRLAPALAEASPAIVTTVCLLLLVGATGKMNCRPGNR